ncbi:MAG: type III-A CRISPR-associated protein Csm2 [Prevotellaceae bacterium]|jgi:CRISPR/Cas system CSM-associated protein Csm2 small subunit|nr:type III-A CRISPR-associated protein Csm2 [Prevotellaceae bacterium]
MSNNKKKKDTHNKGNSESKDSENKVMEVSSDKGESKNKYNATEKFNNQNFSTGSLSNDSINVIKGFMKYHVQVISKTQRITSSQLRNVYNVIIDKDLSAVTKRVKIAYVAARNSNSPGMRALLDKLDKMLSNDVKSEIIRNFAEACVAYHKYFETLKK